MPYRKILCPIDWSKPSFAALKAAGEWAEHFSAELVVLHVTEPLQNSGIFLDRAQLEAAMRNEELQRLRMLILPKLPREVPVQILVRTGNAAKKILELARQEHIDLLVMATHGLGQQPNERMHTVLFGSVTDNVMRSAPCPVLTVPPIAA